MKKIDWDKFAERVPSGTQIQTEYSVGILLECRNYYSMEAFVEMRSLMDDPDYDEIYNQAYTSREDEEYIRFQSFHSQMTGANAAHPRKCKYLINGQWLTFDQIMAGAR